MQLQAKKHQALPCWQPPEAKREAWKRISLRASRRNRPCQHFGQGLHFQTPRFCIQRLHKEWVGEVGCLPLHIFIMNLFVVKSPNWGLVWFYFCPFSSSLMCTVYAGRSFLIQVDNLTYSADHFNLLDLAQTRLP